MAERLLVVDEAFAGRGAGVLLSPRITVVDPGRARFEVELRLPDGKIRRAAALFEVAHIRGPHGVFAMLRLPELTAEDIPAGTEVWALEPSPSP